MQWWASSGGGEMEETPGKLVSSLMQHCIISVRHLFKSIYVVIRCFNWMLQIDRILGCLGATTYVWYRRFGAGPTCHCSGTG